MELCAQAAEEQDPARLLAIIDEINRLLEASQERLKGIPQTVSGSSRIMG
jgi:hypothetical protein